MGKQITIEDLIHEHYYETDIPELIITENGHILDICKVIIEEIHPHLKKSFNKSEFILAMEENRQLIEELTDITNELFYHMITKIGKYEVKDKCKENNKISSFWHMNK